MRSCSRRAAVVRARSSMMRSSSESSRPPCHARWSLAWSRKTRSSTKDVCTQGCSRAPQLHEWTEPIETRCFRSESADLRTNDVGPGS